MNAPRDVVGSAEPLPAAAQAVVAQAWAFRWEVEREASARFHRLAQRLTGLGAPAPLVELCRTSSEDERRHAVHCQRLALEYGATLADEADPPELGEIAPGSLSYRERVLYEVVAASCVTETVSAAVLSTLLEHTQRGDLAEVLRELLRDEVKHSRLGWAYLTWQKGSLEVSFLADCLPYMLAGAESEELFTPGDSPLEHPALVAHGVLPRGMKRQVFVETLEKVVFPGLESMGVGLAPSRRWLESRRSA